MKINKIHKPHKHHLIYFEYNDKEYSLSNYFNKIGYTNNYDLNKVAGVQLRPKLRVPIRDCDCLFEGYFDSPILKVGDIELQDLLKEKVKDGMVYSQLDLDYFQTKLVEYGFLKIMVGDIDVKD